MTQAEVAKRVGIHLKSYSSIETGKSSPNLDTARLIAALFDEPVEAVFTYIEV